MRDKENIMKSKKELLKKLENGYKDTLSSMNPNQSTLFRLIKFNNFHSKSHRNLSRVSQA